ncbi:MAG: NUDIX hydrolase [Polyangiales bacterium]
MSERTEVPVHPAATVICVRDAAHGLEVLLVQRNSKLVFHGGAWVFPGGRVEATDSPEHGPDASSEQAARAAAVRESLEETSLPLRTESLVPLSHWTTPPGLPRRFSTWFFLADAPNGDVVVDDGEIKQHWWAPPRAALERRAAGAIELPPPTFVSLMWLNSMPSVEQAVTAAQRQPFERFVPRPIARPDGVVSLYQGDAGYVDRDFDQPGPRHRLYMLNHGWRYERTAPPGAGGD